MARTVGLAMAVIALAAAGAVKSWADDDLAITPVGPIQPVGKIDAVGPIDPVGETDLSDGYKSDHPDDEGMYGLFSLKQPQDKTEDWKIDDNDGKLYLKAKCNVEAAKMKEKTGLDGLAYCVKVDPKKWKSEKEAVAKRAKEKLNKVRMRWVKADWIDPKLSKPGQPVAIKGSMSDEDKKKQVDEWNKWLEDFKKGVDSDVADALLGKWYGWGRPEQEAVYAFQKDGKIAVRYPGGDTDTLYWRNYKDDTFEISFDDDRSRWEKWKIEDSKLLGRVMTSANGNTAWSREPLEEYGKALRKKAVKP